MYKKKLIKKVLFLTLLALTLNTFAQQPSPSGGYKGGTHGNIKSITWSGAVDEKWTEPGNWCPAVVPDAQDDVVIPASASIMPEVKVNGLSCKSLTIQPGASVEIKPGYTLTVNGREVE